MRSLILLACLALCGCGDRTRAYYTHDGKVDVTVNIYDATPAAAAKRLRDLALSLDGGGK